MADTGWVTVGTGADDSSYGTTVWTNPGRITSDDASTADISFSVATSHYLKGTNLGLAIPAAATIDGIEVQFEISSSVTQEGKLDRIRLVDETGTIGSTDRSDSQVFTTTPTFYAYGGASDLWDDTWGETDVEDADFGFVISTVANVVFHTDQCDVFQVKVYYTEGGAPPTISLVMAPYTPT